MNDDRNLEKRLMGFDHTPNEKVKKSVMDAYGDEFGRRRGFWRRPVPLYTAAAVVIVLTGLSFLAGRRTAPGDVRPISGEPAVELNETAADDAMTWSVAPRDVI